MTVMDPTTEEQTTLWNGPAGRAWVDAQALLDRMFRAFENLLVDGVGPGPTGQGGAALDVGCGTGATTLAVARRIGAHGRCVGIDLSEPMIALARTRAAEEGSAASFVLANAETYAFEPASFDRIVSRFGVMFFTSSVRAFANLRGAARDDAELRCIVWRSAAENPFMTAAEEAAAPLLPNLPLRLADGPGQFALADRGRVHAILEESRWGAIDIQPIDVPCSFPEAELEHYVTRLGPVGRILQDADEATRVQVLETVRRAFDAYVHGPEVRFTAACWMLTARPER